MMRKQGIRAQGERSMMNPVKAVAWSALVLGLTAWPAFAADTGADVFKQKCAMCHGENGAGKGKVPALGSAEVQQKSDADLKAATEKGVKTGNGMMPGYAGKLTPEQIDGLVMYIRSLKK
jgi:mono/diheme cytochrome c family protein